MAIEADIKPPPNPFLTILNASDAFFAPSKAREANAAKPAIDSAWIVPVSAWKRAADLLVPCATASSNICCDFPNSPNTVEKAPPNTGSIAPTFWPKFAKAFKIPLPAAFTFIISCSRSFADFNCFSWAVLISSAKVFCPVNADISSCSNFTRSSWALIFFCITASCSSDLVVRVFAKFPSFAAIDICFWCAASASAIASASPERLACSSTVNESASILACFAFALAIWVVNVNCSSLDCFLNSFASFSWAASSSFLAFIWSLRDLIFSVVAACSFSAAKIWVENFFLSLDDFRALTVISVIDSVRALTLLTFIPIFLLADATEESFLNSLDNAFISCWASSAVFLISSNCFFRALPPERSPTTFISSAIWCFLFYK